MSALDAILESRRADLARNRIARPWSSLERTWPGPVPGFAASSAFTIIAECKAASPSRGVLVRDYDPARLALAYEAGGAALVSVLTEPSRFLGSDAHLEAVRAATRLPILRKDFILDPYQVREAWAIGADVVLLIAACLEASLIGELAAAAHEHGLQVLLEIHDASELGLVRPGQADAIGVNARDLGNLSLDLGRTRALAESLPEGAFLVAESGLKSPLEAAALLRLGYRGFLVGEHFATASDPREAVAAFAKALALEAEALALETEAEQ